MRVLITGYILSIAEEDNLGGEPEQASHNQSLPAGGVSPQKCNLRKKQDKKWDDDDDG